MGPDQDGLPFWHVHRRSDGAEAAGGEPHQFCFVVDNGTEGVEMVMVPEESFGMADGTDDTAAKAGTRVDFDTYHVRAGASRMPNLPWITPSTHTSSS